MTQFATTTRGIPIYPEPGIFETTIGHAVTKDGVTTVTPQRIEEIMARPHWDFNEADLRLTGERIANLQKQVDAVVAKKTTTRKTAAKKTTPRKKP